MPAWAGGRRGRSAMAMPVVTPARLAIVLAAITQLWTAPANGMTPRGRRCNWQSACSSHAAKKPSKSMYSCSGAVGFRTQTQKRIHKPHGQGFPPRRMRSSGHWPPPCRGRKGVSGLTYPSAAAGGASQNGRSAGAAPARLDATPVALAAVAVAPFADTRLAGGARGDSVCLGTGCRPIFGLLRACRGLTCCHHTVSRFRLDPRALRLTGGGF